MAEKRLFKEYNQLVKHHPSHTNHQIVCLEPVDPEDIFNWKAVISKPTKQDSQYYYNGQWELAITVSKQYPIAPPTISFSRKTPINHPNINFDTGEICLDILKSENWSPAWDLQHLIVAILMLIDDPEPDSPLNIDLANLFRSDKLAFESYVQYTIWKCNTFFQEEKHLNGLKNVELCTTSISESKLSPVSKSSHKRGDSEHNVDIIKDVGKQITQEFIDKVDEIEHSKESIEAPSHYNNAKKQIMENVSKQVEELCSKSVSPVNEPTTLAQEVDEMKIDPIMEDERRKFLKEVDIKVNKYQTNSYKVHKPSPALSTPETFKSDETIEPADTTIDEPADTTINEDSASNTLAVDDVESKASKSDTDLSSVSTNSSLNRLKKSLSIKGEKSDKKKSKRDRLKAMMK